MHQNERGRRGDQSDRREVFAHVVADIGEHVRPGRQCRGVAEQQRVAVSGSRATARVVTVPLPADARFSTTICWPSAALILSATARAMMSLLPPGGSAMTSVIGLFG